MTRNLSYRWEILATSFCRP